MEHSGQVLRHCLLDVHYRLCFVPSIQTGDKLEHELCVTDFYWIYGHCNSGLACKGSQDFQSTYSPNRRRRGRGFLGGYGGGCVVTWYQEATLKLANTRL